MKPTFYVVVGMAMGFATAWLAMPGSAVGKDDALQQRTRAERPIRQPGAARPISGQAAAEFFKHMSEAETDKDKRKALFDQLVPEEIPALLANLQIRAGFFGLNEDRSVPGGLLATWYLKSPAAAQAWLQGVTNLDERHKLVSEMTGALADGNVETAMALLRQQGAEELDGESFSFQLFEAAAQKGEDSLLELCRIGLFRGPYRATNSVGLTYREGFDFQRVLDGLADMNPQVDQDGQFMAIPYNLIDEWTTRDSKAAWTWLQQGKSVDRNGKSAFFTAYSGVADPADVGALLAADFKPDAPQDERYQNANEMLTFHPSPELLDAFLGAAPGDPATNLRGLLDGWPVALVGTREIDPSLQLVLERMDSAQRMAGLRRFFSDWEMTDEGRKGLSSLLIHLGHSEEEIQTLQPAEDED